jgi:hypothetical protein
MSEIVAANMVPGADQSIFSIFDESVSRKSFPDFPLYNTSVEETLRFWKFFFMFVYGAKF